MSLRTLVSTACDKESFTRLEDYIRFSLYYLEFIKTNLQAVIVSKNEHHYQFFQYKQDGTYNVTRPINSNLIYDYEAFEQVSREFLKIMPSIRDCDSLVTL